MTSQTFLDDELITAEERQRIVSDAQQSNCGRRPPHLSMVSQATVEIGTNGCRLMLEGDGPVMCILECSADLIQWTPIRTNLLSGAAVEITDSEAGTAPRRFYRVRVE